MTHEEAVRQRDEIEAEYRRRSPDDPKLFIMGLRIPGANGPAYLRDIIAPFQEKCFDDIIPSLKAVRDGAMPPISRAWIERTKKASKDGDIAALLLWLVAFPRRPFLGQIGAADKDQAGIIKKRMSDLLFYNPWLNELVEIDQNKIKHASGLARIDIMAADVAGAHGETPDILVINELSHVTKWEFAENLKSNAAGVPRSLMIIATNAGHKGTKAELWRKEAESQGWAFHVWSRPAPWHSQKFIDEERRTSTRSRFRRLWWGEWQSGKGDALSDDAVARCFSYGVKPIYKPEPGWLYIAGLDLGISHDHAGVFVLGVNILTRRMRSALYKGFEPKVGVGERGRPEVDLIEVQAFCEAVHKMFGLMWFGYDPHQAVLMAQQLRQKGVPLFQVPFTPTNLTLMANTVTTVVEDGLLELYDDEEKRMSRDLGKLNIVEKGEFQYKLESTRDEFGHADVGTACLITLPRGVQMLAGLTSFDPKDEVAQIAPVELSKEEVHGMPDELREIYEMDFAPRGAGKVRGYDLEEFA